jgi:hypothetical protein
MSIEPGNETEGSSGTGYRDVAAAGRRPTSNQKLEKHMQIAQPHVRMIESELGFDEKRRRAA